MRAGPAVLVLPLLGACMPLSSTPPQRAASGVRCDANAASALIGRPADRVMTEAQRLSGARSVRRYGPGALVTTDFHPDRLTVETDAGGKIAQFTCG